MQKESPPSGSPEPGPGAPRNARGTLSTDGRQAFSNGGQAVVNENEALKAQGRKRTVRSAFYDSDSLSVEHGLLCLDPSKTDQSQRDSADINVIVRQFGVTGKLPQGFKLPTFDDFEEVGDYQTAMNSVLQAEKSFMAIPSDIRAAFDNDPQQFVEFCSDPENLPALREMGLAPKLGDPLPTPTPPPPPQSAGQEPKTPV